ncbi:MAG: TrkA family potassium uptake protein [Tissierellia bacterium]|nr:TrkA family potassium uptake protein [Tissierellia bacterium]
MTKTILVIGLGRFGRHLIMNLEKLGHEIMAVDNVPERVENVADHVTRAQIGDATNEEFLKTLGVSNFDLCMVAIGSDFESSIVTTSILSELGAQRIVSRASRDVQAKLLLANGAENVIYPEKQLARWSSIRYTGDNILEYMDLECGYAICAIPVPKKWVGKAPVELDVRKTHNINVLGTRRNGKVDFAIDPERAFEPGDNVYLLGAFETIQRFTTN